MNIDYSLIYKKNNFQVGEYIFTIDTIKKTPLFNKIFSIITACNPDNILLTADENLIRNKKLQDEIESSPYPYEKALGFLDDHKEESFCIYEISFDEAVKLAKKYSQYSIFYHSENLRGYFKVSSLEKII